MGVDNGGKDTNQSHTFFKLDPVTELHSATWLTVATLSVYTFMLMQSSITCAETEDQVLVPLVVTLTLHLNHSQPFPLVTWTLTTATATLHPDKSKTTVMPIKSVTVNSSVCSI